MVPYLSETVQGDATKFSQYIHRENILIYASMTVSTHLPPKEARQCPCKQKFGRLTLYSIKVLHGFTSPHVCRSRDDIQKKYLAKMIRFPNVEPPTQFRRHPLGELPPSIVTSTSLLIDLTNMDVTSEDLHRVCKRFRVLIIGQWNAGKTTILGKMTGSEEGAKPEIRNKRVLVV